MQTNKYDEKEIFMDQSTVDRLQKPLLLSSPNKSRSVLQWFNFEFMDLDNLPNSLRSALRDILEVGNHSPFRNYYQWTATNVYEYAKKNNIAQIVELGAGCAPITKELAKQYPQWEALFTVTDINPDVLNFKNLEKQDSRIRGIYQPIDFSKKIQGFENSLLVLSATFHHIPEKNKSKVLANLKTLSPFVMVFEPLRPNLISLLFVVGALVSGFLTPLFKCNSKKFFRSFLWCWLVPIAPFLFLWDGWVSSFRCWNKQQWKKLEPKTEVEESLFCTKAIIK
jgi:hypothetical protein